MQRSEKITVIIKCAWCGKVIGRETWDKVSEYHFDGCESHGICADCMKKEIADAVTVKAKMLDSAIKSRNDMYI